MAKKAELADLVFELNELRDRILTAAEFKAQEGYRHPGSVEIIKKT